MSKHLIEEAASGAWSFLTDNAAKIVGWSSVLLAPIKVLLLNIYLLSAIDLVTGIWRSWKIGDPIISSKLRRSVSKLLSYTTAILVVGQLERIFLPEFAILKVVAAYIAITEVKSIFENLHQATGANLWQTLLNKLKLVQPGSPKRKGKRK